MMRVEQTEDKSADSLSMSRSYASGPSPLPTSRYTPNSSLNRCSVPSGTTSFCTGSFTCEFFFFRRPFFFVSLFFSSLYPSSHAPVRTSSQWASW